MKKHLFITLLLVSGLLFAFKPATSPVGKKIVEFCKDNMGKQVERGECWDLAKGALDYAGADWQSPYDFGTKFDYKTEKVEPGDILQFENVALSWNQDGNIYSMTLPHHTAVVYEVKKDGSITIAHQNFNNLRKVATFDLKLSDITQGTVQAYRPKAKA